MILTLNKVLSEYVYIKIREHQFNKDNLIYLFERDNKLKNIIKNIKKILEKNYFIVIKNFPLLNNPFVFNAFSLQFGKIHRPADLNEIEHAKVSLNCDRTSGCNFNSIPLHNDETHEFNIPSYGFILVLNEDPIKQVKNNIVKIDDIMNYLEVYENKLLNDILNYQFPMFWFDKTSYKLVEIKKHFVIKENTDYYCQFHLDRVKNVYKYKKEKMPFYEKQILYKFLDVADKFKLSIFLEKGDLLIHNNKKVLHDREGANAELYKDELNSREIWVNFVL